MKKLVSLVLVLLMTLTLLPMVEQEAFATQSRSESFLKNYTLTGNGAQDVVSVALAQVGRTGAQFGYTEQWCGDFASDCAKLAGQSDAVPFYGSCSGLYDQIKKAGGTITTKNPQPGDICFINWDGGSSFQHVEIVYDVVGSTIYTVGGNSSSASSLYSRLVKKHKFKIGCAEIVKILRPNYTNAPIHPGYSGCGVCVSCGKAYDWQSTLYGECVGTYEVVSDFIPRVDQPYGLATKAETTLKVGEEVEVTGRYTNAFGSYWYEISYGEGQTGFSYEGNLELKLEASCDGFSPANGAILERKSQPVKGVVTSSYPLKAIYAYLNGEQYAAWTASNRTTTQVDIRNTAINQKLSFSALADGKYTFTLAAETFAGGEPVTFFESVFYMGNVPLNVTFDANCGTGAPDSQSWQLGTELTLTTATPVRKGYTFLGWSPVPDALTPTYQPGDILGAEENLTLYALWQKIQLTGDVNNDGKLNLKDWGLLYDHLIELNTLTGEALKNADLNGDGKINMKDWGALYALISQ